MECAVELLGQIKREENGWFKNSISWCILVERDPMRAMK
jgi:hypothetical protein